jgi:neogenin
LINLGTELMIETPSDVPDGPPENLKAETINTTALFVRWNRPSTEKCNGLIIGYKLAIKENDKQVWNSQEASEPRSKLINNMLPNQKYSIRVTAMTVNGSGPASDWVVAETFAYEMDENKVPDQPLELVAEPTDKTIVIHWKPPKDSNKTLIRKYLLSYGVNYPSNMIEIPGNQNSYIIKNLEPFSTYIISLKAKNNAGLGKEILKDVVTKRKSGKVNAVIC